MSIGICGKRLQLVSKGRGGKEIGFCLWKWNESDPEALRMFDSILILVGGETIIVHYRQC